MVRRSTSDRLVWPQTLVCEVHTRSVGSVIFSRHQHGFMNRWLWWWNHVFPCHVIVGAADSKTTGSPTGPPTQDNSVSSFIHWVSDGHMKADRTGAVSAHYPGSSVVKSTWVKVKMIEVDLEARLTSVSDNFMMVSWGGRVCFWQTSFCVQDDVLDTATRGSF